MNERMNEDFLHKKLNERKQQNAYRQLRLPNEKTDFSSNDYLGMVKNGLIPSQSSHELKHGATGSRLLSGNYALIEETEKLIAAFHDADAGLIFNSGYDANIGLLSSVPQREDTIIYDQLSHASIRDGIRLSFAQSFSFVHNSLADLEEKLRISKGNIFVVTESVFSMDGDMSPIPEILALCEKYKAHLIIDEAHATGVIGERGEGLVQSLHFKKNVLRGFILLVKRWGVMALLCCPVKCSVIISSIFRGHLSILLHCRKQVSQRSEHRMRYFPDLAKKEIILINSFGFSRKKRRNELWSVMILK
jgi:8-amino-7-oxononanoate synthase